MGLLRHHHDEHERYRMQTDLLSIGDDYWIENSDGDRAAQVSKKWFRVRDSYGIEIYDTSSVPLILAIAVAVEELARDH